MDTPQYLPVASFATGYDGLGIALGRVLRGMCTVVYVEIEAYACENLVQKMEAGRLDAAPIWTDLKTFPSAGLRGKVAGITAGYPCQDFSLAGNRLGKNGPRHLWPHIAHHIAVIRPGFVLLENVRGHVSLGLRDVRCDLEAMDYCVDAEICSAEEVGAQHRRERIFILAYANGFPWHQWWLGNGSEGALGRDAGGGGLGRDVPNTCSMLQRDQSRRSGGTCGPGASLVGDHGQNGPRASDTGRTVVPGVRRRAHDAGNRVDRLRLAGNGVVPTQAEFALNTMIRRIIAK